MPRKRKLPEGMVTRGGRRGYYADLVIGGRRIQKKLGNDFEAAKSNLNTLRGRAECAEWGKLDNNYPIEDLRAAYLKCCQQVLRPQTVERYQISLTAVFGFLNSSRVDEIDAKRVLAYREHRLLRKVSPRTVNHDVTILGSMLNWGVEHRLIATNPVQSIKPLRHDTPKEGRPLTEDEVARLLERSLEPWRSIWYAFLVTGLRKDELASLRFADIDWESREITVRGHQAKNRRERRVPIEDGLWDILKRREKAAPHRQPGVGRTPHVTVIVQRRFTREHVFVTRQNTPLTHRSGLYNAFLRCCKLSDIQTRTCDAGGREIEHVDVHSLRRTFTTNAITNGADPKSVQDILGHRTLDMTMRVYAKVKGEPRRKAVARLSYGKGAQNPGHLLPMAAIGG